jgi:hypothetical protein
LVHGLTAGPDFGLSMDEARMLAMDRKTRFSRWLFGMAVLAVAECACVAAVQTAFVDAAQAQSRRRGGGFFEQLFGIQPQLRFNERERESAPTDNARAPSPRKPDPKAEPVEPTTSIAVLGDGMADWLAYGLEDAFSDAPEIAIVRNSKAHSGLMRYDSKNDLDWWDAARDILAKEKADYVVMMLGVSDRQNIREKDIAPEPEKKDGADAGQQTIIAPEPPAAKKATGVVEFRSDRWEKVYSRRIDQTVAALKSKGVPVFWVGLPSIRGTRSTADAVYLNELYRARAERAGAVYIDIWDGFVDEAGKYSSYGPDYEGQKRRLRSGDGVYFTKYGARKMAHYVEREIRRYMNNRGPIALPFGPMGPVPADGPVARPLAGPVVPLTATTGNNEVLLGGASAASARADATAAKVLVKGDPVAAPAGRADDFVWPLGSDANRPTAADKPAPTKMAPTTSTPAMPTPVKPAPAAAAPPAAVPPKAASIPEPAKARAVAPARPSEPAIANPESIMAPEPKPAPVMAKPEPKPEAKPTQNAVAKPNAANKPARQAEAKPHAPQQAAAPRPPQPVRQRSRDDGLFGSNGPFGWIGKR